MKKTIFLGLILSGSLSFYAQTKWDLNGNSVSSSNFIGTTNNEALVLKANNTIGLKVKPNGELLFKSLDLNSSNGPHGLVLTDGQGVISRIDFLNNANKVLYSDGTWGVLPAGSNLWQDGNGNRIYYNGKVGINTTNPNYQLDVNGDARITNNLYVGGGILITRKIEASSSLKTDTIQSMSGETKFTSKVILKNQFQVDGTTLFNGTVQAGNLYVSGNTNFASRILLPQGLTFDGLAGISYSEVNNVKTFHYGNTSGSKPLPINCAAAPYSGVLNQFGGWLQIYDPADPATSGLLNLQTWAGGSSIDASVGAVSGTGSLLLNYFCGNNTFINTGANGGKVSMGHIVEIGMPSADNSVALNIKVNGSQDDGLQIMNSGDVVNFKVKNTGFVYAREVNVQIGGFPDYVFKKNYKLTPLEEVEKYINENNHLKGFENAQYYETNGLQLGEVVRLQQEKIEELTLYLIELKKEIENLKKL